MRNDYIHNPQIIKALREATEAEMQQLQYPPQVFSEAFEQKMEKLIRKQKRPAYTATNTRPKRVLLTAAISLLLAIITVFSVASLREPVIQFFVEVYEKFSVVFFGSNIAQEDIPTTLEQLYMPQWIPEGFVLDDSKTEKYTHHYVLTYTNPQGDIILYEQLTIATTVLTMDTEGVGHQEIKVNGYPAIQFQNKGIETILWNTGEYGFSVTSDPAHGALLKIAESVK